MSDKPSEIDDILHRIDFKKPPAGRREEPADDVPEVRSCYTVYPKGSKALDIERGAGPVVSLQYVYLSPRSEFTPERFTFFFGEPSERYEVTVTGRNLRDVYNRINDHCVRKIAATDRDFAGRDEAVIRSIRVELVKAEG